MVPPGARGILAASIILPILAFIAVSLRVAARRKRALSLQSDDWTIIVNLIFVVGISSGVIYASCTGLYGISFDVITERSWVRYKKHQWSNFLLTHFVYGLVKISVTLFYKRIFITPRFQYWANATLIAVSMWMISAFFALLLCAHGVSSFWSTPPARQESALTLNLPDLIMVMNIIDIVFDVWVLTLPMPVIKNLHMTLTRKIAVASAFLLGAFCFVASGVRLYYSCKLTTLLSNNYANESHFSDANVMWAGIECGASTITACLPTLGPLFSDIRSPKSLIKSSSLLSPAKKRQASPPQSPLDPKETKRAWYELHSRDAHLTATESARIYDLEAQLQKPARIDVK